MILKKQSIFITFLLTIFLTLSISVSANDGEVCSISAYPSFTTGPPAGYDITVDNPVRISSLQGGFRGTACGVAIFGSAIKRSAPLDMHGNPVTQAEIINVCRREGRVTAEEGGRFNDFLTGTVKILKEDRANCFDITIHKVRGYTNPPDTRLPPPTITTNRNVRTTTYRPYNFNVRDIAAAMRNSIGVESGIGIGAVAYNVTNHVTDAHMVQPIALDSVGTPVGTSRKYDLKIYDPYFARDVAVEIRTDGAGRSYANIWNRGGRDIWFHLEDLIHVKNLGLCRNLTDWPWDNRTGGGGGSRRPVRGPGTGGGPPVSAGPVTPGPSATPAGPTTPTSCGIIQAGACQVTRACSDPNEYCSSARACTCKQKICGDRVKDPGEECDDGNRVETDTCNNRCKKTKCGDTIVQSPNGQNPPINEECDDGNRAETDKCSNACKFTYCGDGIVQRPNGYRQVEECDDGNDIETDACNRFCERTSCGDDIVQDPNGYGLSEQCENTADCSGTDICNSNSCQCRPNDG